MFTAEDEAVIRERLEGLPNEVKLILFSQTFNCETCPETEGLIKPLAELSDQISLQIFNPQLDRDQAELYKISEVPSLVVMGERDYGIRYLGTPGGYEFASLLEDIISVGRRESGLSPESKEKIQKIAEPLHLKVFVTPT
jgi:alkyl hydroperoxide reductase subunit AhpF